MADSKGRGLPPLRRWRVVMRFRASVPTGIALVRLAIALPLVVLTLASAFAAPPAGTVEGVAVDGQRQPLAGVRVRLEAPGLGLVGQTTSAEDGGFSFAGLAPRTYTVVGEKDGFDRAAAVVTVAAASGAAAALTLAAQQTPGLAVEVVAKRLNEARNAIQPRIGASTYAIPDQAVREQPGGENNPLNQILLQAPGVSQEAFGQLHVRNEMANIQYRINGVILPEGVSFFGQSLSPRYAGSIDLITGALPAQYGLRTAGIIDIATKSGAFDEGGAVGIYGGSHGWLQPSAEYGGSVGRFKYFLSGDYLRNGIGIENPTGSYNAIHDDTQQGHGFAYLEGIIDDTSKVSAILGTYRGQFQIPNIPGQSPGFTVNGISTFDSAKLDENQRELNHYGVLTYLKSSQDFDVQVSGFTRYSSLTFRPDPLGDLVFNGIAQNAYRRSIASGLQAEASYKLAADHTLRSGVIVTGERSTSETTSLVLPASGGVQTGDRPETVIDNGARTGWTYSFYLQDEWRITPRLTFNYGGRFDLVDALTHESQISPRLNAVWLPTPRTTVHAGYAQYFSPPPFEHLSVTGIDKFIGTTAEPGVLENSPVKAERDHYFDIGVTHQLYPGLKAGIDAYYKYARNLIDIGQFGAPIIFTPFNYHLGRNQGVELTATYENGPFSFYGNLAIAVQKAKGISSAQFNFAPDKLAFLDTHTFQTDHSQIMTASGGVSYLWKGTRLGLDMLAGSGLRNSITGPNQQSLPSWEQVNLGISHRFDIPKAGALEVRFDVINLFDEIYKIRDGTGVSVGAPQFGPRRSFFAGVRKEF